ncbi:type III PLP-dependent enzyme [Yinghuangia seranimata]|uniref:type III PLP-dependent enzyme n=1 Tax=Yinghuangia seranimata TaxID=408067 RepID=UPI00248C9758|nr:type III PLP-dependent enzyme [Yinghuangia seranimata]MDI2127202.1 type III PLP-dependent enzyme [Yinghuangia seranimata]
MNATRPTPEATGSTTARPLLPEPVRAFAETLPEAELPAYVHDLAGLAEHAAEIASALPPCVEFHYAAKANPDAAVLRALAPHLHGVEVASGGEYAHVRAAVPGLPIAFGGPGKTPDELAAAVRGGVRRLHVESVHELRRVALLARAAGRPVDVLLRANPPVDLPGGAPALAMGGRATPFGMSEADLRRCAAVLAGEPLLRVHGLHAHLASGLGPADLATLAGRLVEWAVRWSGAVGLPLSELNIGGGMAVDYSDPGARFDWRAYGAALGRLDATGTHGAPLRLRVEPGRAVTAHHGWYVTEVLDLKHSRGRAFAVVRGGTHHLRTPAARGHSQPFAVLPRDGWDLPWPRPGVAAEPVTLVGQLCTPKDVLAADVPVPRLRVGDRIAFATAGAYAWNISHRDFLMHPPPTFHHLPAPASRERSLAVAAPPT